MFWWVLLNPLSYQKTIDIYKFGPFLVYRILTNVRAALVVPNNSVGWIWSTYISFNKEINKVISQDVEAIDLYLAYAEDLDTSSCFLDFQEISASLRNIQKPVINLCVLGHPTESES